MTGRLLIEPTSPFVIVEREEVRVDLEEERPRALLLDLLGPPERIADRLLDPRELERTLLGSIAAIAVSTGLYAVVLMLPHGAIPALRSAALAAINPLIALAAAFGPIWAAGILVSARLPLSRLVGTLVTSAAAGALILAALAPIPHFLLKWDPIWAGPLAVVLCFAVSALIGGARIRRTLVLLAEHTKRAHQRQPLDPAERDRVAMLARTALIITAFTGALAVWGFDAFLS